MPGRGEFDALRTYRYLYAEYSTGERELYDLERDPYELQSRHADGAYAPCAGAGPAAGEPEGLRRQLLPDEPQRAAAACAAAPPASPGAGSSGGFPQRPTAAATRRAPFRAAGGRAQSCARGCARSTAGW